MQRIVAQHVVQHVAHMLCNMLRNMLHNMLSQMVRALLCVPRHNLERYGRRSFSCAGPVLWNSLPEDMRLADSLNSFKSHLKTHYFKLAYNLSLYAIRTLYVILYLFLIPDLYVVIYFNYLIIYFIYLFFK